MRFAIVYGKDNIAGKAIVNEFKKLAFAPQFPIIELKKDTLWVDDLNVKNYPELRGVDFIIYASTHKSAKGNPSLSMHAPGNWRGADLGGAPGKVCKTSSFILKYLFKNLEKIFQEEKSNLKEDYALTLEVTHHGPIIDLPCLFIELGSSEKQWRDTEAAKIIAKTILTLEKYKPNKEWIPTIGIGGPHYAPNFNSIQLNSNYAIGHIIPEYSLPMTESMLKEAESKTIEQVKEVLIDWKGCGKSVQRQEIITTFEKLGLKYKRTSAVEK